jgi:hypothetical protein
MTTAPSRAQVEATRRALKSLQRKGYVTATPETDDRTYGGDEEIRVRHVVTYRLAAEHPPLPDFENG